MLTTISETELLESWLDHELHCQAFRVHDPSSGVTDIVTCSHEVAYRLVSCHEAVLACQNAGERGLRLLQKYRCNRCGKPASECWQIVPV